MLNKPFAESCEQNKFPILDVLQKEFAHSKRVLEIGSGTGQHAVFFAEKLPHLEWYTSEQAENLPGINAWIDDCNLGNIHRPFEFNVSDPSHWPNMTFDGIFSANTAHIMSWADVQNLFDCAGKLLECESPFCLYGPFNYDNQYTSDSNARFDQWLKDRDPDSGIRNFEDLVELGERNKLTLQLDYIMPANNRTLVWRKQ
jgi:cyclopropane fatty-acyl-phospholipid synthase-like methyltransferase